MILSRAFAIGASCLALSAAAVQAAPVPAAPAETVAPAVSGNEKATLTTPDGRQLDVFMTLPASPRGVIIFSHGGGSSPQATQLLYAHLAQQGFAVLAPLHTDSRDMPEERRTSLQAALGTRAGDMRTVGGYVAQRFPGLPLGLVGYSFGSLAAILGAGALSPVIPGEIEGVDAVVMFSSPGPIPGLMDMPTAFTGVTEPTLLITGTADTVPGFVPDPALHLIYLDRLPEGDHTAFVVKDATHGFIGGGEAGMDEVAPLAMDFLLSRMLGDVAAGQRFDGAQSSARVDVRRR